MDLLSCTLGVSRGNRTQSQGKIEALRDGFLCRTFSYCITWVAVVASQDQQLLGLSWHGNLAQRNLLPFVEGFPF